MHLKGVGKYQKKKINLNTVADNAVPALEEFKVKALQVIRDCRKQARNTDDATALVQKIASRLQEKNLTYTAIFVYPITEGNFIHNCEVAICEDILEYTCLLIVAGVR